MLENLSEVFFKSKNICLFCKEEIENKSSNEYLCFECEEFIRVENKEIFISENDSHLDRLIYSLSYNRFLREKFKEYKYYEHGYLYKVFGQYMMDTIRLYSLDENIDCIMFIPSSRKKHAKKLYNQSELLANYISDILDKPIKYNLKKIKDTREQNKLDGKDRLNNLEGSFGLVDKKDLESLNILLIDDLVTTGSTFSTSSKILKEAGVACIIGLALSSTNSSGKL